MKYKELSLIVRTNKYTGNFERELTAYSTGVIGECGMGVEEAKDFREEYGHAMGSYEYVDNELVDLRPTGDHYIDRPCDIATEDGNNDYHNVEIFLERMPKQVELDVIIKRVKEFCTNKNIEYLDCFIEETITTKEVNKLSFPSNIDTHKGELLL